MSRPVAGLAMASRCVVVMRGVSTPLVVEVKSRVAEASAEATPRAGGCGMSALTGARKAGAAAEPVDGPAKTRLELWLASAIASVPLVVMGEPVTVKIDGAESATLETVPEDVVVV